jgi:hypothetical protein
MSAPQIPNLNTLRKDGGRRIGRGRGGAAGGAESSNNESDSVAKDRIVQSTDNDAATSRMSAIEAGYLDDPFTRLLSQSGIVERRLPLMNRGQICHVLLSPVQRLSIIFRHICSDNSHRSIGGFVLRDRSEVGETDYLAWCW